MLAEVSTTEIARKQDVKGLTENRKAAQQGGSIAGNARKEIESRTGKPVISPGNLLSSKRPPRELK
ncbi:MAG: hypothetical protein AAB668_01225 [Patescibacteria group bacterium]